MGISMQLSGRFGPGLDALLEDSLGTNECSAKRSEEIAADHFRTGEYS